jgi:hypothetical protein
MCVKIENWKICPVKGGGVCLLGDRAGQPFQSSNIVGAKGTFVKTENSVYQLGQPADGLWPLQLGIKRPEKYAALKAAGVPL